VWRIVISREYIISRTGVGKTQPAKNGVLRIVGVSFDFATPSLIYDMRYWR